MKVNLKLAVIVLAAVGIGLGMVTCADTTTTRQFRKDAKLNAISIGSVDVPELPKAIELETWNNGGIGLLPEEYFKSVLFNEEKDTRNARIRAQVSPGARVEWCIGSLSFCPDEFIDTRVPVSFETDDFIYIRVTSENEKNVNYYRFYTKVFSWVTDLASISIAGREAKPATGGATYELAETAHIFITTAEAQGAAVEYATFDPNATVRFASRAGDDVLSVPQFQPPETTFTFVDQDYLYVEVTAENTIDKNYFKFRVNVGRMATIASLIFNDGKKDIELFGKGLPNSVWGRVGPGEYKTAHSDQPAGGYTIKIELDDPDGSFGYQVLPAASAPGANAPSAGFATNTSHFENGDYFVVRVRALNGGVTNYYHIKVILLAANIAQHPQSAWYYQEGLVGGAGAEGRKPVAPLTIKFTDGTDTSAFTYQWYEADSLFGIYGRHGMSLDEKNNVSTINGGPDMYYYLSQPGIDQMGEPVTAYNPSDPKAKGPLAWEADISRGAKTNTYTPRIDWTPVPIRLPPGSEQNSSYPYVPSDPSYNSGPTDDETPTGGWPTAAPQNVNFFAGSTSEVRYYWVVVTDTASGYTVTSDRAVILTETDKNMEHYIFELSSLPRKNSKPFAKLRELYKIDLIAEGYKFPDGFNPQMYGVCIAQAQYYLPDGRPWTQNWTHGDLHFGYEDNSLTWWHNNLGANSGAIPLHTPHSAQGGLTRAPDWVGFAPSGDPGRGLPPTVGGKLPVGYKPTGFAEGAAQGYFCGFIELMELRFATAPK